MLQSNYCNLEQALQLLDLCRGFEEKPQAKKKKKKEEGKKTRMTIKGTAYKYEVLFADE